MVKLCLLILGYPYEIHALITMYILTQENYYRFVVCLAKMIAAELHLFTESVMWANAFFKNVI